MKKRRVLIIHESSTFRSIIKRTLTAEVPDVDIHTVSSAPGALKILDIESFDMVISANEMAHMNGTAIYEAMNKSGRHMKTGFLLLTSKLDDDNRRLFKEKGINNVLKLPFQAGALGQKVENLSNPREWRRHMRIEIPDTKVHILHSEGTIPADIVNISLGGMLCDHKVTDGIPQFSTFYRLYVRFPEIYGSVSVNARGYTLRQAALHWLEPPSPDILQSAWRLEPMDERDNEIMKDILDKAIQDIYSE